MPTGLTWSHPPQRAFAELSASYAAAIERGIVGIANRYAPEIETWMKANAPWTDRTGNARQALYTDVNHVVREMVELIMAGGVEYQIYLELKNAGAYAIINPAIDHFGPLIWQDVVRLLS
jgi:hypothetical protein